MPTTHTTPIDLRSYHGRECEAVLNNNAETHCKGKISVNDNGQVFVCQDVINCTQADDKLGFKYSWSVQRSDQNVFWKENLISITILDPPSSIDPRWDWKDGEEVHYDAERKKVCRIHKDIVVFVSNGNATGCYTNEEAYKTGYRKIPSPPTRKLTEITEEMFDKTNLIGRKVVYGEKEYSVVGMHIGCGNRFLEFTAVSYHVIISQCKLIEE